MPTFRLMFKNRDIFAVRVPRSGASYSDEFEWREAARWAHYTWEQFAALDGEEQSAVVAHYRGHHQLEAVVAHEQARESRRKGGRKR